MCRGVEGDVELAREQVWEDDLWRLTTAVVGEIAGFSYLEPKRHVRYVHELDGPEAATLGAVLARSSAAIKDAADAELVYVYAFGDSIDHLHLHLAPHHQGGPLSGSMIRGDLTEETLPSGAVMVTSAQFPALPEEELRAAADRLRAALQTQASATRGDDQRCVDVDQHLNGSEPLVGQPALADSVDTTLDNRWPER
ncbi:MAG: hypothetical protein JWR83_48 [Aeromicrobium sp.]|nr:hypothetical protein [Aeromicrobium sp.]